MRRDRHNRESNSAESISDDAGRIASESSKVLAEMTGAAPVPLSADQMAAVQHRLRALLGEALEQSKRVHVDLTPTKMAALCDELIREAGEPGYRPAFANDVEGFFLSGVFEDLVQQPSNIFDHVHGVDGRDYYVPMTPEQWIACLRVLRLSLLPHQ